MKGELFNRLMRNATEHIWSQGTFSNTKREDSELRGIMHFPNLIWFYILINVSVINSFRISVS
jgi:hypothetical protein